MIKSSRFRRVSEIKDKRARTELARAHGMIGMLSAVIVVLLVVLDMAVEVPILLLAPAVALLCMVMLFSFAIALYARKMPLKS